MNKTLKYIVIGLVAGIAFGGFSVFYAKATSFNEQINYQGKLANSTGVAVADGYYCMKFVVYDALTSGSDLWSEEWKTDDAHKVHVISGLFSIMLGSQTSISSVDFNDPSRYLEVQFDAACDGTYEEVFSPRKQLGAVPAAFEAKQLGGATWASPGSIGSSTPATGSFTALSAMNGVTTSTGGQTLTSDGNYTYFSGRGFGWSSYGSGQLLVDYNEGTSNMSFNMPSTSGMAFQAYGGGDMAQTVFNSTISTFSGNVGIGTTIPTTTLDVNGQIRLRTGATNGYVLTSDASGTASWTASSLTGALLATGATTGATSQAQEFANGVIAGTYNGLTLATATTGFTIAGGTTSKTLTLSGDTTISGGTSGYNAYWSGTNTLGGEQYVATSRGGTGADWSAVATGSIPYFGGYGTLSTLNAATSGWVFTSNGANAAPSWAAVGDQFWSYCDSNNNSLCPVGAGVTGIKLAGSTTVDYCQSTPNDTACENNYYDLTSCDAYSNHNGNCNAWSDTSSCLGDQYSYCSSYYDAGSCGGQNGCSWTPNLQCGGDQYSYCQSAGNIDEPTCTGLAGCSWSGYDCQQTTECYYQDSSTCTNYGGCSLTDYGSCGNTVDCSSGDISTCGTYGGCSWNSSGTCPTNTGLSCLSQGTDTSACSAVSGCLFQASPIYSYNEADFFRANVPNGVPPLTTDSSTKVDNLNADLLDGYNSTDFQPAGTYLTGSGTAKYLTAFTSTSGQIANFPNLWFDDSNPNGNFLKIDQPQNGGGHHFFFGTGIGGPMLDWDGTMYLGNNNGSVGYWSQTWLTYPNFSGHLEGSVKGHIEMPVGGSGAGTAPAKFNSTGASLTVPEVGAIEFTDPTFYATVTDVGGAEVFSGFNRAGWTLPSGWDATNGGDTKIDHTANGMGSATYNSVVQATGQTYTVSFTVNTWSTGNPVPYFGSATLPTITGTGTYTATVTATGAGKLVFPSASSSRYSVNSISIKRAALRRHAVILAQNDILTSGNVPYVSTGGRLIDSTNFTFNGTRLSSYITLGAGTTAAGTSPLKFTSGTNLTAPEAGAIEYDGSQLYFTPSATRNILAQLAGSTVPATGSVPYFGGTAGTLSTITAATSGYVFTSNGANTAPSWAAAGVTGANTALSNLASLAINTSLLPGVNNSIDLGSSTMQWKNLYVGNVIATGTISFNEIDATGVGSGNPSLLSNSGTVIIGGTGNTNNENLAFDFETTADSVSIASTSSVSNITWTGNLTMGSAVFTPGSAPATGTGAFYYDTTLNVLKVYDSTGWDPITTTNSSLRYKHDVLPLKSDWLKILQVQPKSFVMNGDAATAVKIGYVAEDFDALGLKNLVQYDLQGKPNGIYYDRITLYDTEIIKQQQIDINLLKQRLGISTDNVVINPAGTVNDGEVSGVKLSPFDQSIGSSISKLGASLSGGIMTLKQVIADSMTVKTARVNGIEMVDSATGDIYCTWIANGEMKKEKGNCSDLITTAVVEEPVQESAPVVIPPADLGQAVEIPAETPAETPIETPAETPQEPQTINISSVAQISDITVAYGTETISTSLPPTVEVTLSDSTTQSLIIAWDNGTPAYDFNTSGTYVFSGDLTLPDGVTNTDSLKAGVNVIVQEPSPGEVLSDVVGASILNATSNLFNKLQDFINWLFNSGIKAIENLFHR